MKRLRGIAVLVAIFVVICGAQGQRRQAANKPSAAETNAKTYKVSGRVVASKNITDLASIDIRLDLVEWNMIGKTDSEGRFEVEVPAGKHRLIAYLPENARFDVGAGGVDLNVAGDMKNVSIQILPFPMVKAKIVDRSGKPVKGVWACANWNAALTGPGFVSPKPSDESGIALLYIYPRERMFVGAFDREGRWKFGAPGDSKPASLREDQVLEVTLRMTEVPAKK
jgi:hypothetical protein